MTVETTVFADANPAAIAAFARIPAFRGRVHRFPPGAPDVATPPFGLLAVRDVQGVCLDLVDSFGAERNPGEADLADGESVFAELACLHAPTTCFAPFCLRIHTESRATSAGVTPLMREAWPRVDGRICVSFCRDSLRSPGIDA